MEQRPPHKRSKSQLAKSLLHKVSSRHDSNTEDDPDSPSSPLTPTSSNTSNTALTLSTSQSQSNHRQPSTRHKPHLSMTMSHTGSHENVVTASPSEMQTSPFSPTGSSIEQSVKLFKVFEALRSGDTAAISKALREQSGSASNDGQQSLFPSATPSSRLEGTTVLHLAIQCAELPVIEYVLSNAGSSSNADINARDRDGNTPLHVAAMLGRTPVVRMLLDHKGINDTLVNHQGKTPLDLARTPDIFEQLQLARSIFIETNVKRIHDLVATSDHEGLEKLLTDPRVRSSLDVNSAELATEPATVESGGTLLHEAARKRDMKLIQLLLLNGADPFKRDRQGKLPQDVTKDDRTRAILKKSPAAAAAQRGIQEKTILGGNAPHAAAGHVTGENALGGKEAREMKGYLKKWTNYTTGWKLRWFVLEDGVLSYYKHQDDAGSACRGAINMKIAQLHMDPKDKLAFELHGKSSVKYHLKANHQIEAKRWFWALNNAIQWAKDEARAEERRNNRENEAMHAKMEKLEKRRTLESDSGSLHSTKTGRGLVPGTAVGVPLTSANGGSTVDDDYAGRSSYEPGTTGAELGKVVSRAETTAIAGDIDDDEDYGDDASSHHETRPVSKDAMNITAQSAKLQLDLLGQVSSALKAEKTRNPTMQISDPVAVQALESYEAAVSNLRGLIGDLLRISKDRDAYWQYRLDRETNVRRLWEESMAKVAREQEELEHRIGQSEYKRRNTKRALREALEGLSASESRPASPARVGSIAFQEPPETQKKDVEATAFLRPRTGSIAAMRRRSTIVDLSNISDDESDVDEEFFDAVDAGEVEVVELAVASLEPKPVELPSPTDGAKDEKDEKTAELVASFKGYEEPIRTRLKMDADNRPKISLWGILKSMIGKDMTKMTLPVSFNEPTSLLQRVAEDMEYTDLLDIAAERADSTERLLYVAAFAASEYASTIGRVAKPFNPLLGETYEYARPDKGYRFFIEQVSHHPPVGAAWAESQKWDYWGESAVKSKFYGKSFDINPLGTWFLRLRPTSTPGKSELYTWKKVTTTVIGIVTGNPTVDNYGPMEVKNWTTGEVCTLDFKPRGWKASSAYQVSGKVTDADGKTRWSLGGRWNDRIYARLTPGFEDAAVADAPNSNKRHDNNQAFIMWEAHKRPSGIPFNLTPFVLSLNNPSPRLLPYLAPTDTRLRPDQRAMEEGEYDFAAAEKSRLEEGQRARRRQREASGEEFVPRWFRKGRCEVTGEEYWVFSGEYWRTRDRVARGDGKWEGLEEIF